MSDLGSYLEYDGIDYLCTICDRWFGTRGALDTHCRATTRHEWCERCRRVFVSESAKDAHIRASNRHHVCSTCSDPTDFESAQDLDDHLVDDHHACLECNVYFDSALDLRDHDVSDHYLCDICDEYFRNENNLRMHQQRHQDRSLECYGCYQTFKSFSGMLIHLESGACPSDTTEETIDDLARECYQSKKYTVQTTDGGWLYECPDCERGFGKLSALYQHVEDVPACSYLARGNNCLAKLEHFIACRV
ncbi:hypothetical protein ASPBRDRAFT_48998 [Aspergillus brasiliensis CBS 101740]|uniref:C2H2-type domain-containing protein n=1 Tax=Aspergillus brasiliensis (strain CBS 101740 / IMI 381727 / IBT 21946) TaxID=767769 RepID=A0A1L9U481_ASPBC|nr:hypothetical protein ASPBRDRAFT_48998 [Aspergillus brasiliensis CBS 101740]